MKPTNNHECIYKGYKLSSFHMKDMVDVDGGYIFVGSDVDDTDQPYRVEVEVIGTDAQSGDEISSTKIDFEDLLIFAKQYCPELFERVNKEYGAEKE